MGIYAGIYSGKIHNTILENKKKEFIKRIENLFQAGGMMRIKPNILFGKRVFTIHKVKMGKAGMRFNYNYFEEDFWEPAGVDKESFQVFSNKIGYRQFMDVIVASYVLEEHYVEETAVAVIECENVTEWEYVGWINYLFKETYSAKNYDSWKLFEKFYDLQQGGDLDEEDVEIMSEFGYETQFDFGYTNYAFISKCEIYSVLYGTEKAIQKYSQGLESETLEETLIRYMKTFLKVLKTYKAERNLSVQEQIKELLDSISKLYENGERDLESISHDVISLKIVLAVVLLSDAPAFAIKGIAELYDQEFWKLWKPLGVSGKRIFMELYNKEKYYIRPISTDEFLGVLPDDMIYYWSHNHKINFSAELYQWFDSLKNKFDIIIKDGLEAFEKWFEEGTLRHIIDLMEEAEKNYFRIFTFTEFLQETKDNADDKRYLALWKIYEEMLRDPKMLEEGRVIFQKERVKSNEIICHWWDESNRGLIDNWNCINIELKNNNARVTLRRYMALVANKKLRRKVFGF